MASSFVPSASRLEKYQRQAAVALRSAPSSPAATSSAPSPVTFFNLNLADVSVSPTSSSGYSSLPGSPRRLLIFSRGGDDTPRRGINSKNTLVPPGRGDLIASTLHTVSIEEIQRELEALLDVFEAKLISESEYQERKTHLEELQKEETASFSTSTASASSSPSYLVSNFEPFTTTSSDENDIFFTVLDGKIETGRGTSSSSSLSSSFVPREREIRVFLSSTFKDMQEERDWLVKTAFPQLRKFCEERGVFFAEVDLRWGITAEQAENCDTLDLCLTEIDRCRPYFINITKVRRTTIKSCRVVAGKMIRRTRRRREEKDSQNKFLTRFLFSVRVKNRYGWIPSPDQIKPTTLEKFPWLKRHLSSDSQKSVTELEVWHATLNEQNNVSSSTNNKVALPPSPSHPSCFSLCYNRLHSLFHPLPLFQNFCLLFSFFCLLLSQSLQKQCLFYTKKQRTEIKLSNEDFDNPQKLESLKKQIKEKGFSIKHYETPSQLGELVVKDLRTAIEADFKNFEKLSKLEKVSLAHQVCNLSSSLPSSSFHASFVLTLLTSLLFN
jgi:hypothetical protein